MPQTYYHHSEVAVLAAPFNNDPIALALSLLLQAATFAVVPISQFRVGAIAIDTEGNFYLGANQETAGLPLSQTVHAEQSAVAHAFSRQAKALAHMVVNHTPCGHCRQFLTEVRGSENLHIHLPHSRRQTLSHYLPDSFSPADLAISQRLLDRQNHPLELRTHHSDALARQALQAACRSYAPYSRQYAGIALVTHDGSIFSGLYAENAAYNPSLPPLQSALNMLRLAGKNEHDIARAALACLPGSGHEAQTQALWHACGLTAPLHIHLLKQCHLSTQENP